MPPRSGVTPTWIWVPLVVAALVACGRDPDPPVATAATAAYTILQLNQGSSDPVTRIEGRGDFTRMEMTDTQYVLDRPFRERMTFGNVTYTRLAGEAMWDRDVDAATPEAKALVSILRSLLGPRRATEYLRTVADDVVQAGAGEVRGDRTTHHRATADLSRVGGPPGYLVPLEIWVDAEDRTRRVRYSPLGEPESTVVWELYDFGIPVELAPPPSDQVK